jgi:uncharacterized protein (TIGR03492 family)
MKLLCLSNGHGEDAIALRILKSFQTHPAPPKLAALPIVGEGVAYREAGIPIVGMVKRMPSGGFIHMDNRQLVRDVRRGLVPLTLAQLKVVKAWARSGGAILAVGDIVPLLFAWWSGAPYAFVGTAKSDYYLRDEAGWLPRKSWWDDRLERWWGSVYHPWERWLMTRRRCKAVFPRDRLTTERLQQWGIPAIDAGNPMMDDLGQGQGAATMPASTLSFVVMPGSRIPEAYENWQVLLQAIDQLQTRFNGRSLRFLGAIAPTLDLEPLIHTLTTQGWSSSPNQPSSDAIQLNRASASITLSQTHFAPYLQQADFALAMTGTGTEQFVGLGKPALIFPGKGPQFTPRFAEAQTRLLGISVSLVPSVEQTAVVVDRLLSDPDRLQLIAQNGLRRMGSPGAAQQIADHLTHIWQ